MKSRKISFEAMNAPKKFVKAINKIQQATISDEIAENRWKVKIDTRIGNFMKIQKIAETGNDLHFSHIF